MTKLALLLARYRYRYQNWCSPSWSSNNCNLSKWFKLPEKVAIGNTCRVFRNTYKWEFRAWNITVQRKFYWGKNWRIWQIVNCSPKVSSPIFTIHRKCIWHAYTLTVTYLPKLSSPMAFTCMVWQNFLIYSNQKLPYAYSVKI